ncbi:MFS transporter [Jatrophihabitans telluris]|uniref:MFS transporter n=1 Tax=Jatrophihabitans telluris TaxID=2038343 RepID=A0ABY4R0F4_9ACTN|nr:MFS transporter [Jatrophihabitans telluris]UQX88606.1 MFS transporter [Jatrophihabitans telluris]
MSARVGFSTVLKVREFRALWLASAQSMAGDQLARVAISVLVFERTSNSALTALTYALTFLPALIGGILFAGLADRLPRRRLMIWCDLLRAVLIALMAVPAVPLPVLGLLLIAVVVIGSPFGAAENALAPMILDGEAYEVGTGLRAMTDQVAQLLGFALGGVLIALLSARGGLLVDAATFLLSALLIRLGVRERPRALGSRRASAADYLDGLRAGAAVISRTRLLRVLLGLGWLAGLFIVPEGVAAPLAAQLGGGARSTGLILAAMPAGTALGTLVYSRLLDSKRRREWLGPMSVLAAVPLICCQFSSSLLVTVLLLALTGAFTSYEVQVFAEYARAVPDRWRGQAIGLAASGVLAVQGLGVLLGGLVAQQWSPEFAVCAAGLAQLVLALMLARAWRRLGVAEGTCDEGVFVEALPGE